MIQKILVVEDDTSLSEYLKDLLGEAGFAVETVADGVDALSSMKKGGASLVVLDLGLPKISGETVCTELKKKYPTVPIIILTAKSTTSDVINGLNLGADDYLAKPFDGNELIARIKARLRENPDTKIKIADLELDPA